MAGVCEGGKEGQRVWWEERFPTTGTKPAEPDLDKVALPRLETMGKSSSVPCFKSERKVIKFAQFSNYNSQVAKPPWLGTRNSCKTQRGSKHADRGQSWQETRPAFPSLTLRVLKESLSSTARASSGMRVQNRGHPACRMLCGQLGRVSCSFASSNFFLPLSPARHADQDENTHTSLHVNILTGI